MSSLRSDKSNSSPPTREGVFLDFLYKKPIRVLVDHIICYYEGVENSTRLELSNDRQHAVSESLEEIDVMIEKSIV